MITICNHHRMVRWAMLAPPHQRASAFHSLLSFIKFFWTDVIHVPSLQCWSYTCWQIKTEPEELEGFKLWMSVMILQFSLENRLSSSFNILSRTGEKTSVWSLHLSGWDLLSATAVSTMSLMARAKTLLALWNLPHHNITLLSNIKYLILRSSKLDSFLYPFKVWIKALTIGFLNNFW